MFSSDSDARIRVSKFGSLNFHRHDATWQLEITFQLFIYFYNAILCISRFANFISRTTQFSCYYYFVIIKHHRTYKIHSFYCHYFFDIETESTKKLLDSLTSVFRNVYSVFIATCLQYKLKRFWWETSISTINAANRK